MLQATTFRPLTCQTLLPCKTKDSEFNPTVPMMSVIANRSLGKLESVPYQLSVKRRKSACICRTRNVLLLKVNAVPERESETTTTDPVRKMVVEHTDSVTDILFIAACRLFFGKKANFQSPRSWTNGDDTFRGMVEVSRALMKGKNAEQQRQAVLEGFPTVSQTFRKLFPYTPKGAEINASITPMFFQWLVGPCSVNKIEVPGHGELNSGVKIEQCRYLKESNCVGLCVNLCKIPTQTFFTEQLGVPLTMDPNFEDYSCQMSFGVAPPSLEEDEALQHPCLKECSSSGGGSDKCFQLS
jgi:hypothetical protein